jgi:hypothetical protein
MISLIGLFLVVAPILILYTIGYRYDWQTKQIKKTGVISIDVEPDDVDVYLNNTRIKKNIPIRLTNIAPEQYDVRIEKPGYKTWQKDIIVISKQTTFIKDVTLIKDQLPTILSRNLDLPIKSISASADGRFVLISYNQENLDLINLVNLENSVSTPISRLKAGDTTKTHWSNYNSYFAIITQQKNSYLIRLFDGEDPETQTSYSLPHTNSPIQIQWLKNSNNPLLYTLINQNLYLLTNDARQIVANLPSNSVWFVDSNQKIWVYEENKKSLINHFDPTEKIILSRNLVPKKIIDINNERIILQSENNIHSIRRHGENAGESIIEANNIIYNPSIEEWLVWSPWGLWTIHANGNTKELNRTGKEMISVSPLDDSGVLLIRHTDELTAFNPGYFVSHKLFEGKIEYSFVDVERRRLYFLGFVANKHNLYELEL